MDFNALLTTFANNLLPILLISGAGFLLGKTIAIDLAQPGPGCLLYFQPHPGL